MRQKRLVHGKDPLGLADGFHDDGPDRWLTKPEPQQRIVELAKGTQRPEPIARADDGIRIRRLLPFRTSNRERRHALLAVEIEHDRRILDGGIRHPRLEYSKPD